MPKILSLGEIIRETFELMKSQPIILAPMLICSVALTLLHMLGFGAAAIPNTVLAYVAMGSVTISLWFQLWTVAMVHLFITTHDIDLSESLRLAFRAWMPVLLLYVLAGTIVGTVGYVLYKQPVALNVTWVLLGPLALVLCLIFLVLVIFLPVILIVEKYSLSQNIGYIWMLIKLRAKWIFRWIFLNLFFVILVTAWSLVFVKFPILPPIIQGLASSF